MRPLTEQERVKYTELTKQAEQIQAQLDEINNAPRTFGYVRVSSRSQATDGNSLEAQKAEILAFGASEATIYVDVYTGTTTDRPELDKLLEILRPGDTLVVAKLDRISRSVQQGIALLDGLAEKGIKVNVLNMGMLDDTPTGRLMRNMLLAFAEFERDMILQRTREGKEAARKQEGYREGRKAKYTETQIRHAISLLKDNSYSQVVKLTGISKSTLIRANKKIDERI